MLKYSALSVTEWYPLFASDSALLLEFIELGPAAPRRRATATTTPTRRNGRSRKRDPVARPPPKKARGARTCFSRIKLTAGKCAYTACKFGHSCVSCGGDHAAVACRSWDQKKADAFMTKHNIS